MDDSHQILERLMAVIDDRRRHPPDKSYTVTLLEGGVDRIGCKVMEEASEVVRAARHADRSEADREQLVREAADLIYHLFVLLGYREVPLAAVTGDLARRFGISGLDEKAARGQTTPGKAHP